MEQDFEAHGERRTYPQNWRTYNAAQVNEKDQFLKLLHSLCAVVEKTVPSQTFGRPRIPFHDILFSICFKVYSTVSARRFMCDLRDAQTKGYISKTPHFNSIYNYLESPGMTEALTEMLIQSSLPLASVETDFAADSSGFSTSKHVRWFDYKYGEKKKQEWVKAHIMCGVKTNIITAAEISTRKTADNKKFPDLIKTTGMNFDIAEVSADKAYGSFENYNITEEYGALPFIAFRKSHTGKGRSNDGRTSPLWTKMYHYFQFNREDYLNRYHKRSNVESTFAMIKNKFGSFIRSKGHIAMENEVLAKIVCHNICVLIQEMYGFGLNIEFLKILDEPMNS